MRRPPTLARVCKLVLVSALAFTSAAYAANLLAVERGWQPVVTLAGARDSARAVRWLRDAARLWEFVLHHSEVDATTRELADRATRSLRDFNLRRMYELLPDQDGRFHALALSGGLSDRRYRIGRRRSPGDEVGPTGRPQLMGDASLLLRAAPVAAPDGDTNYLLHGGAGVVVGDVDWSMVIDGAQDFLRLLSGSAEQVAARQRGDVLAHNPRLGPEDVVPVATLWEAFPRLAQVGRTLGVLDDLVDAPDPASPGVSRIRAQLHLEPARMQARYPELAEYFKDLDRLFEADVRWLDAHNRTLALLHLSSESLSARLELHHRAGLLLPSRVGRAAADQPLQAGPGALTYSVLASVNVRAFGIGMQLRGLRMSFEHARSERGMQLHGRMRALPTVSVTGAALGFIPPGLIDAVIPGDIQGLADKSLRTACEGNQGRGVELDVRFDRRPGGAATLDGKLALEALDNFLVKLGAAHFNSHVLPDEDVREDVERLLNDLQQAFSADLERYARAHPG